MGMKQRNPVSPETIADVVRKRRKALSMNQAELALVSGTGVRFISDLENAKASCELGKTLNVLANLGIEVVLKSQPEA